MDEQSKPVPPKVPFLFPAFFLMILFVDAILAIVIGIGILSCSGEGVVAEKLFKHQGSPSIRFASGEIIPAVGVYYSIEKGDRVKKELGSLSWEINGRRVNAWFLYLFDLVRFTFPGVIALALIMWFAQRNLHRLRPKHAVLPGN